jgi:ribose 5-phosphate isomerase A
VIASAGKAVGALAPPVPLELMRFGARSTLAALAPAQLRPQPPDTVASPSRCQQSPDGGLIADYLGPVGDPAELSRWLSATPGLVGHGLFAAEMVSLILIAREDGVERRAGGKQIALP